MSFLRKKSENFEITIIGIGKDFSSAIAKFLLVAFLFFNQITRGRINKHVLCLMTVDMHQIAYFTTINTKRVFTYINSN